MYKIVISGYYGFNNIGDESILTAVVNSLREKLDDIEITVLSASPESTAAKYGVKSVNRRSFTSVMRAVRKCDLLISGGGSLLQDVTSRKSIHYYLFIMAACRFFRKKFFIYSQGIGPIVSKFNSRVTAKVLNRASGIVVRDTSSKELLVKIGVPEKKVVVTADPVLRIKKADLAIGNKILEDEGFENPDSRTVCGMAIKERRSDESFINEMCISAEKLISERNCRLILIPFHFSEDMTVIERMEKYLAEKNLSEYVCTLKNKYLTEEMLSVIGNTEILVGVRLHSLIHAAIMDVPMIGISYDPKVNSFLHSVGMKAMCSIYDFKNEFFIEEYDKVMAKRDKMTAMVRANVDVLIERLDTNEEMIKEIMEER